jgi:TolB-like protein
LRSDPAFQKLCEEKVDKSIAALPFENLSNNPDNDYFAAGIQDEILTRLAKIGDLKVISRTSTQRYHSKPGNLAEIAKELGVANILEGSVQKAADQVRVNVQLPSAVPRCYRQRAQSQIGLGRHSIRTMVSPTAITWSARTRTTARARIAT